MSYSQVQTVAQSEYSRLQARLQVLVQELQWSYVALWSLDPETRNLEYSCGHWQHTDTHDWNENFFNCTFKFCQFGPHCGSAAMAYAKGSNVWMYGPSVLENAGSTELVEFLRQARISTVIFIPWTEGVLELGTCGNIPENRGLMEEIRRWFLTEIETMRGQQQASGHSRISQATSSFPHSSLPMMLPSSGALLSPFRHLPDNVNTQTFEPHSLIQQIFRRSASTPKVFLEEAKGKEVGENTDNMLLSAVDAATRISLGVPAVPIRAAATTGMVQTAAKQAYYQPVSQRIRGGRSRSGTTSSSVSSLEEAVSTRLSGDSTEQNVYFRTSSQRQPSHSNTSSPPRRGTSSGSPERNQLEDAMRTPALQGTHELQLDAIRLMLEGEPLETGTYSFDMSHMNLLESGTNSSPHHNSNNGNLHQSTYNNNESQHYGQLGSTTLLSPAQTRKPFKPWRQQARGQAPVLRKKTDCPSQDLLRRCLDMMKQISQVTNKPANRLPAVPTEAQPVMQTVPQQHGSRLATSSTSPETVADSVARDPFGPVPPRGQRRPRGGSRSAIIGAVHHGHNEAAMSHMMAERRRRVRQKENFAQLRRLVPIISKADKASILGDAIVYLKQLETRIEALEAGSAESQRKHETLQRSYNELEQRNKELESLVRPTRLHSMQSL